MLFFFFFQAEDGIRDSSVTGVQTCALPISRASASWALVCAEPGERKSSFLSTAGFAPSAGFGGSQRVAWNRSEERRVGKEWRCGRGREDGDKRRSVRKKR